MKIHIRPESESDLLFISIFVYVEHAGSFLSQWPCGSYTDLLFFCAFNIDIVDSIRILSMNTHTPSTFRFFRHTRLVTSPYGVRSFGHIFSASCIVTVARFLPNRFVVWAVRASVVCFWWMCFCVWRDSNRYFNRQNKPMSIFIIPTENRKPTDEYFVFPIHVNVCLSECFFFLANKRNGDGMDILYSDLQSCVCGGDSWFELAKVITVFLRVSLSPFLRAVGTLVLHASTWSWKQPNCPRGWEWEANGTQQY